jgi:hypothetical protein
MENSALIISKLYITTSSHHQEKFFFFFAVLVFELRAYTLNHSTSPSCDFFFFFFPEIGSRKLFAWAGFEPQSSSSLPPE